MAQAGTIGRQPGTIRTVDGPTIEYCLPSCTLCMMSDPGSDFRLYHSNSLDVLAALLARNVRAPVPGQPLLAPEVVLIPQVAMRRWL